MDIEDWKSQLKRGTLEFSIMLMLSKRPHYGYEIMTKLDKWSILSAKESTIYPLLRRLLKEEYLSSVWQETAEGLPPRKYYSVTDKGAAYLHAMTDEWEHLQTAISEIASEDTLEKEVASTPPEN
ncbi:MAG: PadR family transcriptional regulator [Muribaculaceae bacterium]|nr:PadR family transcriptional regulator [Muribaculaceae bacterium]